MHYNKEIQMVIDRINAEWMYNIYRQKRISFGDRCVLPFELLDVHTIWSWDELAKQIRENGGVES